MKRIALFCLLGLCLQATAQKNYQRGQVVLTNGDTLKGFIDYRNWHINPTSIRFKQDSLADDSRQFTTNDIRFFQVAGDKYLKAFITKDMLPVDVDKLAADSTELQQTDTAFLRVLVEGPLLNLYEVYDFKPHYYIQDSTKSYRELTYKKTLGVEHPLGDEHNPLGFEHIKMHVHDYYHGELMTYLLLQPNYDKKLARQIQTIGYTDKDLGKVVAALNGLTGQSVAYVSNSGKKALSFYAGAGAIYSTMTFSGDNPYVKGMDFGWRTGPAIMAGVELFSDRKFRELSFRLEVAYSSIGYKADHILTRPSVGTDTIHYEVKQQNITPSITGLYHIIRTEKFRYYIGAQLAYSFSSYPTNTLTAEHSYTTIVSKDNSYLSFDKGWPMVNIKTGAIINRRWDVSVTGSLWGRSYNTTGLHNSVKQYALWLGYHFR